MSNTLASCEVETPEGGIEKSDIKEVEEEVIHNNNNGIISTENNINKEEPPPPPSKDLDSEETTSEKEEGQQETTSDQEACAEACECEDGTCEDDSNPTDTQNTTQNIPIKKKKRRSRKSTLSQHLPRHSSSPELPTHKINTNKSTAQPNILSDSQTTTTTTTVSDGATSPKHPLNTMTKSSSEPLPLTADIASLINENSSTPSSSSSSPKNLTSLPPNMAPHSPYDTSHIPQHLLDLTPPPTRGRSNAFYGSKAPPPLLHSHSDGAAIASQQTSNTIAARRNTTTAGMMMMMANGGVVPAGMQLSLSIPEPSCSGISKPKMFNYWRSLSNSNCEKVIHHSKRFLVGFAETIGRRPTMEDCMVVNGSFRGRGHEDYFALFDGHGGKDAADFAALHLHEILAEKLKTLNPVKSLKEAFNETHNIIADQKIIGGTTAVVALFIGKKGFIANVGDTRAVLCRDGVPLRVSLDHKPELPAEMSRIRKLGGTVTTTYNSAGQATSRVNGMLAVSRALGDAVLSPYVSSEPEIHGPLNLDTESRNQFVVLACDGVWDVLSDEEATSIVAPIANPEIASRRLRDEAFARGSTDNISVMVIRCPPFPPCD